MPRGVVRCALAAALVAGCLPPPGLETARVVPRRKVELVGGAEVAMTTGTRHSYRLVDRGGELASVDDPDLPREKAEVSGGVRAAFGVLPHLELELSGWNPLIPPIGVGAAAGPKVQLLGGAHGRLAVAVGARAGGYAQILGESGNQRWVTLGMVEGRALASVHLAHTAALIAAARYRFEAVHDELEDSFDDRGTIDYGGGSSRWIPGLTLGATYDGIYLHLDGSYGREAGDDPEFFRFGVSAGGRFTP